MISEPASGRNLIIDTTPDFRMQVLRHNVRHLENVLFTHTHADHCHGLDDLRAFYFFHKEPVQCWIASRHVRELRSRFSYVFHDTGYIGTKPQIVLHELKERTFSIGDLDIETVELPHGNDFTSAFRIGSFAYATDFKKFPENIIREWKGKVKIFIASGIGFKEHPTHSSIPETIQLFKDMGVTKGMITHLSHSVDYERDKVKLPTGVEYAYDGMEFLVNL
jgi:phosphoribosyl 1,2-cyclic phosphate phosphodiesterase